MYRCNGVKNLHPRQFSPAAATLYRLEAGDLMSPRTARIAISLAQRQQLPGWAASHLDLALLEAAKG